MKEAFSGKPMESTSDLKNIELCASNNVSYYECSGNVQLMQDGAVGLLTGALVVVTVRRGENQFRLSQGQEHVFRKRMEAKIAPS